MRSRISKVQLAWLTLSMLGISLIASCAHSPGYEIEPARFSREIGFEGCTVSEPLRRYQALDLADRVGNPELASSPEWAKAISMMQPGDDLRRVFCKSNRDNFFGLFRGNTLLFKFGGMIYD
jgi:hypothetical protein